MLRKKLHVLTKMILVVHVGAEPAVPVSQKRKSMWLDNIDIYRSAAVM